MPQVFNRRRKLHGVPTTVRGQFDHERREAVTASIPVPEALGFEGDLVVRRGDFEGGYNEVHTDPAAHVSRCLLDGAPHRTDGAAITAFSEAGTWSSYWLHGREVSKVTVWRQMAPDAERFDEDVRDGWRTAVDIFKQAQARGAGDAAEALERMTALPPEDQDMRDDPESAAFLLGQHEAGRRLTREWLVALYEDTEIDDLEDALDDLLDPDTEL